MAFYELRAAFNLLDELLQRFIVRASFFIPPSSSRALSIITATGLTIGFTPVQVPSLAIFHLLAKIVPQRAHR